MTYKFQDLKKRILPVLIKYKVERAAIFGSYASGRPRTDSDIDLLVSIPGKSTMFISFRIKNELEKKLQKKVDVVEYRNIVPQLRETILREQRIIAWRMTSM